MHVPLVITSRPHLEADPITGNRRDMVVPDEPRNRLALDESAVRVLLHQSVLAVLLLLFHREGIPRLGEAAA